MKSAEINKFVAHPDRDEILAKLLMQPIEEIHDWLQAKYKNNKTLVIPAKTLTILKNEYLNFYTTIKQDTIKLYAKNQDPEEELQLAIQNNSSYQKKLQEYLDNELDIKSMLKKMIAQVEYRAEQLFDLMQDDPRNIKNDRNFLEFMNTLLAMCEKYRPILEGPAEANITQNNINIQVIDRHINVIEGVIRETLSQLDIDTSLAFIENFTEKMATLKPSMEPMVILPVERTEIASDFKEETTTKLLKD